MTGLTACEGQLRQPTETEKTTAVSINAICSEGGKPLADEKKTTVLVFENPSKGEYMLKTNYGELIKRESPYGKIQGIICEPIPGKSEK